MEDSCVSWLKATHCHSQAPPSVQLSANKCVLRSYMLLYVYAACDRACDSVQRWSDPTNAKAAVAFKLIMMQESHCLVPSTCSLLFVVVQVAFGLVDECVPKDCDAGVRPSQTAGCW